MKKITEQPDDMKVCMLEVLVMPNGEILCEGTTVGLFNKIGKYLFETD